MVPFLPAPQTLSHEPKVLQEGLLQLDTVLSALEPLHRPIEAPGGSVLLRELAGAGHVADATLSAQATPLLHALTAAHAYIMMFVHTCRVGQVHPSRTSGLAQVWEGGTGSGGEGGRQGGISACGIGEGRMWAGERFLWGLGLGSIWAGLEVRENQSWGHWRGNRVEGWG